MKKTFFKLFLILSLWMLEPQYLLAQKHAGNISEQLTKKGKEAFEKGDYTLAFEHLTNAELILEREDFPDELAEVKKNLGIIYRKLSNYGEALGYFKEAIVSV